MNGRSLEEVSERYRYKIFVKPRQKPRRVVVKILMFIARAILHYFSARLRTFALIVSAHPYCARNSLPRQALSARAVEEMWRYIPLVGTLVSMHEFNSLEFSVTPYFLLINHFVCQLSTF